MATSFKEYNFAKLGILVGQVATKKGVVLDQSKLIAAVIAIDSEYPRGYSGKLPIEEYIESKLK